MTFLHIFRQQAGVSQFPNPLETCHFRQPVIIPPPSHPKLSSGSPSSCLGLDRLVWLHFYSFVLKQGCIEWWQWWGVFFSFRFKLSLKFVLLSCQDSALASAKLFSGFVQPPRAKKGWWCFLQPRLPNNREAKCCVPGHSTKSPYLAVWWNVGTVSSQGGWACLCLCQEQAAGILTTCEVSGYRSECQGYPWHLARGDARRVQPCIPLTQQVPAHRLKRGQWLSSVVSETPNVVGPLAPIRQLGWSGAAAAAWVGGEQACSEPPGRLLLLHYVDLGWVVQNIVISVASLMLFVSLWKQINFRLTAIKEIMMLEIKGEAAR